MLYSMTGYGAGEAENEDFYAKFELKAVNGRYLDLAFHSPRSLAPFEGRLRRLIQKKVARGKIDVFVTFLDKRENAAEIHVNRPLALAYQRALNELSDALAISRPDRISDFLFDGVVAAEESSELSDAELVLTEALTRALDAFNEMRAAEGGNLREDFLRRTETLVSLTEKLAARAPEIVAAHKKHLEDVFSEVLPAGADETRIIEETALYADRVNYTEEVVRLRSHFDQFKTMLAGESPIGRKMDFLIQEMNREANTIGSKASDAAAAQLVVDLKSEIEKLREQVQNIE